MDYSKTLMRLMDMTLHAKQLINMYTSRDGWNRTVHMLETRWVRPVQAESLGNLYLIGCWWIIGPCQYLSF